MVLGGDGGSGGGDSGRLGHGRGKVDHLDGGDQRCRRKNCGTVLFNPGTYFPSQMNFNVVWNVLTRDQHREATYFDAQA